MRNSFISFMFLTGFALLATSAQAAPGFLEALNPGLIIAGDTPALRVQLDATHQYVAIEYANGSAALYALASADYQVFDAAGIAHSGTAITTQENTILLDGQPFAETSAPAHHVAMSLQGTYLAAALDDDKVVVYETATATLLTTLPASSDTLLFQPGSDVLAVNNPALNQIIIWQPDGSEISLPGQTPLQFSPDGAFMALVNHETTVTLRRMEDVLAREEEVIWASLSAHYAAITDVAFTPDSRLVASASRDGSISLWDVAKGVQMTVLMGHESSVNALAFSPDGTLLASADDEGEMRLWDVVSGQSLRTFAGTGASLLDIAFSDGMIATAGEDGRVIIWQAGEAVALPMFEASRTSDAPLALEQAVQGKAHRALTAGQNPLHPVGCFIEKDNPVQAIGRSGAGSMLVYAPGCEGPVWTNLGSAYFSWHDPLAVQTLPLIAPEASTPRVRMANYEEICSSVQDIRAANPPDENYSRALYPPDYVPSSAQANLETGVTTVICHDYETRPVENCHYLGPGNYSYIFTRQRLYDTIRLVDYTSGGVMAQRRFEGATPPRCPGRVTRGTVTGAAPSPDIWMTWVLESTGHRDLLPLHSRVAGPQPAALFAQPESEPFDVLKVGTTVNVIARSGEAWLLILRSDMTEAWVRTEDVALAASTPLNDLPETLRAARQMESITQAQQIANLAMYRPLGRVEIVADYRVQSPDGFYVAGIRQQEASTLLGLWDIRGGQQVWQVSLPDRQWETIQFSPTGETLMVKTNAPYPAEEEIRLTFYDTLTGDVVSETGDIDLIDTPIIPGNMPQTLVAEPYYTRDGQAVIVSYGRRTEAPRCAVWDVHTAQLIWEIEATCGTLNNEGRYMIVPRPYTEISSAYSQLVVYEVATGAMLVASQDEVIRYTWLNDQYVFIERPYGEAPVLWNILDNTSALLEMPQRMGSFQPYVLNDVIYYSYGNTTYVWDMATGALVEDTILQGMLVRQPEQVILLQEFRAEDSEVTLLRALNLANETVMWQVEWQHSNLSIRADGLYGFAYNYDAERMDIFDLQTGAMVSHILIPYFDFLLTSDWQWIIQGAGNSRFTVWGDAKAVGLFDDPPELYITEKTDIYYETNTTFPTGQVIPAGQYVWVLARTPDANWVQIETDYGRQLWVPTTHAEFLVDIEQIPSQ